MSHRFRPGGNLHSIDKDLMRKDAYPEHPKRVELVQTHISFVFITDDFVYKVKKSVNFGFLDFTTIEKRAHFCEREVSLNRRLAPDMYLGVVPVTDEGDRLVIDGKGGLVDHAVKMRRLPMDLQMKKMLEKGTLDGAAMGRVARRIADFHASAERSNDIDTYGTSSAFRKNTDENFQQTEPFIGRTISQDTFDTLREYTDRFYTKQADVFARRVKEGRTRDCHGDLHMEHILLTEPVVVFDCIEFNDRFRYSDTAADIAFLAMDLDFHKRADLSKAFIDAYLAASKDKGMMDVLNFYKVYRAYVRGKVHGFRLDDPHISETDKDKASKVASSYFALAKGYIGDVKAKGKGR